jgi:hypothetical protein
MKTANGITYYVTKLNKILLTQKKKKKKRLTQRIYDVFKAVRPAVYSIITSKSNHSTLIEKDGIISMAYVVSLSMVVRPLGISCSTSKPAMHYNKSNI